jgi:uncharacterized HAD superfamily protein
MAKCYNYVKELDEPIPYEIVKPRVYSVDIDGTLCSGVCWDDESIRNAEPKTDIIDKVNALHEKNFIVIHTARRHERYLATVDWLTKNGVRYHAICMEKMPSDKIIDLDVITKMEDIV